MRFGERKEFTAEADAIAFCEGKGYTINTHRPGNVVTFHKAASPDLVAFSMGGKWFVERANQQ